MKLNRPLCLAVLILFSSSILAQTGPAIFLNSGKFQVPANINQTVLDSFNKKAIRFQGKSFAVLQFNRIPTDETRKILSDAGIELLDFIPELAYTASINQELSLHRLQQAGVRAIFQLGAKQKMDRRLAAGQLPSYAVKVAGTIDVWVSFPASFTTEIVKENLRQLNMDIVSEKFSASRILHLRVATNRLEDLAGLPFIEYVQPAPQGDQLLNYNSRYGSRANILNASVANGGKALNGEGVAVGIGDNADMQTHIDFSGRLINRTAAPLTAGHGHHVTGTVAGAGNGNELYKGYASKATIVSQTFNGILLNAPVYVNDYGMVLTNNSYGDNLECDYYGTYDLYSRWLDQMAIDFPNLQNVFSAGNSGSSSCAPFQPNYHTVLGGYQSAKNVITVGATTDSAEVASFSSRGPVRDGRIKPEIVAMGQRVASAWASNLYSYNNGTSMSSPAVTGGLTLLYQRYRQLNANANPKNGLMKALLCNGATDRGNAGPDFQYGYGWMDLLRSVEMLENSRYFISSLTNGAANTHTISVPANTSQLKVLLYWNDPAASVLSSRSLVNDLDLEVVEGSTTTLPKILDTSNANLGNPAVTGADHLNNMEQVVINNPAAGNYTLRVKGTAINQNPSQEYFLVYDAVPIQLKITAPAGGEGLAPSTVRENMLQISWESFGLTGTATLELSLDDGLTWTTINNNVDINRPVYSWWVPDVVSSQARVRITKNGSGESSTSLPFTIVGQPTLTLNPVQCEGYFNLDWTTVAGATDYEVMMLKNEEMQPVATTAGNNYSIGGLSKDSTYWVTVRARVNGKPGRRPQAISRQPLGGSCAGSISDNDLKIDAVLAPVSGRKFTSTQLNASTPVSIRVKNLDDVAINSFELKYSVNGAAFITETISTPLAAGATYTHYFSTPADLSATGNYAFVFVAKNLASDPVSSNDSAFSLVRHIDNQPLDLSTYFTDNLETAQPASYEKDTVGIDGALRYDFVNQTPFGRLRSFVNSGMAYSGSKAFTLDASRYYQSGNTNYLYGTFNLVNYNTGTNDLRLDFVYNNHGQYAHPANRVWIRGTDSDPWIEVYSLDDNQNDPGSFKKSSSIELSDILAANGQGFGTSFQVRWGQWGQITTIDRENAAGYTFDDIRVYEVFNDLQMMALDEPFLSSCGLTAATPVKISIRNSANSAFTNIPVKFKADNGNWITETIPSIAANAIVSYTFTTTANLSSQGSHSIIAVVDYPGDSFRENDTARATVMNSPVISSFPHLEDFEAGAGSWYAYGKHNSWEYGTPASRKINHAASGAKAWKTRLAGNYNDMEYSFLYSPCYDLTGLSAPTLSFSVALDIEDCGAQLCDGAWVEYSTDGRNWIKLGSAGQGTHWYNKPADQLWSIQNYTNWHVATIPLPTGLNRLRLRFVLESDPAANREGMAIDDIHIYDNTNGIYSGSTMSVPVTQASSGNNWINFIYAGQLVASIRPNNQDLGSTAVQAYIHNSAVRFTNTQYYHNRNITIKPANTNLADSVSVRFYFLDSEVDSLRAASGCTTCSKPGSAYDLLVSKYSDPDNSFENGTLADNNQGIWNLIASSQTRIVPFDRGYYAEFRVKDFSEFWLSDGGFDRSLPLPVKMLDFTARKTAGNNVLVSWTVAAESNVLRYEIEVARTNADLQANNFVKIGELPSQGNSNSGRTYEFTDAEPDKFGTRYYRIKIVNQDGSFTYSPIRPVTFEDVVLWQVYPNPSKGLFNLVFQLGTGEVLSARVLDSKGSLVKKYRVPANGVVQKLQVDLTLAVTGVYLLETDVNGKKQTFKLYKH